MAVSMIGPKFYAWDRNGKPLAFGKLYTYQARTNTPKPTYQSEDQIVENTNPVILSGEGYANVYLDGSYKMVLKDKDENEIWSSDPVTSGNGDSYSFFTLTGYYSTPTEVKVLGDYTKAMLEGMKVTITSLQANGKDKDQTSTIISSTFDGDRTAILIADPIVTTSIKTVSVTNWPFEDIEAIEKFVESNELTFETPQGQIKKTITGIERLAFSKVASVPLNNGAWAESIVFNKYNEYMIYNGIAYKPKTTTVLPYVSTLTPDVNFVEPFSDINTSNAGYLQDQLSGLVAWPISTNQTAAIGDIVPAGTTALRDANNSVIYWLGGSSSGQITALDFSQKTATIGGVDFELSEAPSAFLVTALGTDIPRTLAERFAETINVKDFGAVGDGVTDDTQAIQKAIDFGKVWNRRVFVPTGEYLISSTIIIKEGTWLEGELHFFRGNNQATDFITYDDITAFQFQNYTLGHKLCNLRIFYKGTYGTSTQPAIKTQDGTVTTTSGMGSQLYNIYVNSFSVGFHLEGWIWQQYYFNCFSDKHTTNAFYIKNEAGGGAEITAAALIFLDHCSAINGNIATVANGFNIQVGSVRIENPRMENNAYAIRIGGNTIAGDATRAAVSMSNGYFEGNRVRDIEIRNGGNFVCDYAQFLHQNAGVTTFSIISTNGDVGSGGVCHIGKAIVKANNGNNLSYLVVDETGIDIRIDDLSIGDLENEMVITPQSPGRYAPRYIGMSKHGFDLHRETGQYYYIKRNAVSNNDAWRPLLDLPSISYELDDARFYDVESNNRFERRRFIPGAGAGEGYWFFLNSNLRPVKYNNTANLNGNAIDPRINGGVLHVNFGAGNYSITVDDSLMHEGDLFTVSDDFASGSGTGAQCTVEFTGSSVTYVVAAGECATFRKSGRVGAASTPKVIRIA